MSSELQAELALSTFGEKKRLRRVVLLCCHFIRNFTYYRAGHYTLTGGDHSQILVTIDGNFLDMAVIDWCKLFGDKNGKHYWGKVLSHKGFERELLSNIHMTKNQFVSYVDEMRRYRDKFLAHLDDEDIMDIPNLDIAEKAVLFLHDWLVRQETLSSEPYTLPTDLTAYQRQCSDEVSSFLDIFTM